MKGALIAGAIMALSSAALGAEDAAREQERQEFMRGLSSFFAQSGLGSPDAAALAAQIAELQDQIKACGDCPEKAALESRLWDLREAPRGELIFNEEKFASGLSEADIVAAERKSGAPEDCIALYWQQADCERKARYGGDAALGPCADQFYAYKYCKSGDAQRFAQTLLRMKGRSGGGIVPRLNGMGAEFGKVPESFNPPVPPPELMNGRRYIVLSMKKDAPGALSKVWVKRLDEWVFDFLNATETDYLSRELDSKTIEKGKAVSQAAQKLGDVYVLQCDYNADEYTVKSGAFWWGRRPEAPEETLRVIEGGATAYNLRGTVQGKFILLGGARTRCPDVW